MSTKTDITISLIRLAESSKKLVINKLLLDKRLYILKQFLKASNKAIKASLKGSLKSLIRSTTLTIRSLLVTSFLIPYS